MRNLIDIINGNSTASPPTETLLEGKHFEAMFTAIENMGARYKQSDILETVQSCKNIIKSLKRKDRQAWAARILRLWMIDNMIKWTPSLFDYNGDDDAAGTNKKAAFESFISESNRLAAKYKTEYLKTMNEDWLTEAPRDPKAFIQRTIIHHYLAMPYSKIQNYVFSKGIIDTTNDLEALAKEFAERTNSLLTLQGNDEIIIRMPDNFVWVLLDRGYCGIEAQAMGHCGNSGAKADDRILSLRRIKDIVDGVPYMEVFLTFILNGDGKLGEMKGRGNDKPAERYHPQIIALLEDPIIKGIRGGGWLPKNNFSLKDLPDDVRAKLLDEKPHLAGWTAKYERAMKNGGAGKEFLESMVAALREATSWTGKAKLDEDGVEVYQWDSIDDLVEEFSDDDHTNEVASGQYFYEDSGEVTDDSIENLIDGMPVQWQIIIGKLTLAAMQENGADEDEIEDFDMSSSREIVSMLDQYGYELKSNLESAIHSGNESGAQSEAHKLLVKAINDCADNVKLGKMVFSTYERDGEIGWTWDSPVKIVLSIPEACEFIDTSGDNGDEFEYDEDDDVKTKLFNEDTKIEIEQPYYGYSDFDEAAAIERLGEEVDIGDLTLESRPPEPDFATLPTEEVKSWIEAMYEKIPDGFIRKVHVDTLPEDRIRLTAKGLFKKYYG